VDTPSRHEAVSTLREGQKRLDELLARLSDEDLVKPATIGGGDWSAKDLIGHVAAWEEQALISLTEWRRGEMPAVERPGGPMSGSDGVDAFNARAVDEKRGVSLQGVVEHARATHQDLLEAIDGLSDEEWLAKAPYQGTDGRDRLLATLLGFLTAAPERLFGHVFAHLPDLEAYVRSVGAP
jgi:hypothetical protein